MEIVDELPDYSVPDAVDPLLVAPQPKKARRRKRKKAPAKRRGDKGKGEARPASTVIEVPLHEANEFMVADPKRMVVFTPGFAIEGGGLDDDEQKEMMLPKGPPVEKLWDLEGRDNDYEYYKMLFCDKEHWNFLGAKVPSIGGGPMAVSIIRTGEFYTALVRTVDGNDRREVPCNDVQPSVVERLFHTRRNPKAILRTVCPELHDPGELEAVDDPRVPELLLTLHERQRVTGFKFGLLYAARGQTRESEFFCNTKASPMFDEFCDFLGERIELAGWDGFRGGLDVRTGSTGKYALFTEYNPGKCPTIFHVSTFLPFDPHNEQQLERKRHIGNDLVVIVFQDSSEAPFRPVELSSRMIHTVILIRPVKVAGKPGETWYRMAVVSKADMPAVGPSIDNVALYKKGKAFRELLLQRLYNSERACYMAPILSQKMAKTRALLLQDVIRQLKA